MVILGSSTMSMNYLLFSSIVIFKNIVEVSGVEQLDHPRDDSIVSPPGTQMNTTNNLVHRTLDALMRNAFSRELYNELSQAYSDGNYHRNEEYTSFSDVNWTDAFTYYDVNVPKKILSSGFPWKKAKRYLQRKNNPKNGSLSCFSSCLVDCRGTSTARARNGLVLDDNEIDFTRENEEDDEMVLVNPVFLWQNVTHFMVVVGSTVIESHIGYHEIRRGHFDPSRVGSGQNLWYLGLATKSLDDIIRMVDVNPETNPLNAEDPEGGSAARWDFKARPAADTCLSFARRVVESIGLRFPSSIVSGAGDALTTGAVAFGGASVAGVATGAFAVGGPIPLAVAGAVAGSILLGNRLKLYIGFNPVYQAELVHEFSEYLKVIREIRRSDDPMESSNKLG